MRLRVLRALDLEAEAAREEESLADRGGLLGIENARRGEPPLEDGLDGAEKLQGFPRIDGVHG